MHAHKDERVRERGGGREGQGKSTEESADRVIVFVQN
jgi:hypothetical protein